MAARSHNWDIAEEAARKVIQKVQPASVSDVARRKVVRNIQRLIKDKLGIEVYAYGSMPLKTYLPEGDMDFTVFCDKTREVSLANELKCILEEEKNTFSVLRVSSVELVGNKDKVVKLVKCIVQGIPVDISFNKIDGLYNLCFLEEMDRLIGNCHLFKRSIILIKSWCYYESRILGAKNSLIATHALAILVVHIFYLHHLKLEGPLVALYTFLDYYSKFDWETYCVSVHGRVRLDSLPNIVFDVPKENFLSPYIKMFSIPSKDGDPNFLPKHLNIIDPLKTSNNLGQSVNKANHYRIRCALTSGFENLTRILSQSEDNIASELHNFFKNTMCHAVEQQPEYDYDADAPNLLTDLSGDLDRFVETLQYGSGQLYKDVPLSENCTTGEQSSQNLSEEDEYNARYTRYLKDILKLSSPSSDLQESSDVCDDYELWLSQRTCAFHYASEQQSILESPYWLS